VAAAVAAAGVGGGRATRGASRTRRTTGSSWCAPAWPRRARAPSTRAAFGARATAPRAFCAPLCSNTVQAAQKNGKI